MGAIYLVRHGQASFGSSDYDKLSDLGHDQARVLGAALRARGVRADAVVCGGMRRHHETARACLEALGAQAEWHEDLGWNEYDHEEMLTAYDPRLARKTELAAYLLREGNPKRAFQTLFEKAVERWTSGTHDDDYDETFGEFCGRIEAALERLHARLARSQTALVFTSGGAISAVCRKLLGLADDRTLKLSYTFANASVTKLIYGANGVWLSSLNEHSHFEGGNPALLTYR